MIVLGGFAETYQFLVQDEIQSYHWSKYFNILLMVMEIFNTILFVSSLMITHNPNYFYKIQTIPVMNNIRIAKTLFICVIISKILMWMLNGYSLQLVMASHHAMVLGDLLNVMLRNIIYKHPYMTKFWATNQCLIYV